MTVALNCFNIYFKASRSNSKYIVKPNPSCLKDQSLQESTNPNLQKYNYPWAPGTILKMSFFFFFPFLSPQPSFRFSWKQLKAWDDAPACRVISYKGKISTELYNSWNFKNFISRTKLFLLLSLSSHLDWPSVQNGDLIHLHQTSAMGKPWEEFVGTSFWNSQSWENTGIWTCSESSGSICCLIQKSWDGECWGREEKLLPGLSLTCAAFLLL